MALHPGILISLTLTFDEVRYDHWKSKKEKYQKIKKNKILKNKITKKQTNKKIKKSFPCKALCKYEKLRESNIREREKSMIKAGFYDDYYSWVWSI